MRPIETKPYCISLLPKECLFSRFITINTCGFRSLYSWLYSPVKKCRECISAAASIVAFPWSNNTKHTQMNNYEQDIYILSSSWSLNRCSSPLWTWITNKMWHFPEIDRDLILINAPCQFSLVKNFRDSEIEISYQKKRSWLYLTQSAIFNFLLLIKFIEHWIIFWIVQLL